MLPDDETMGVSLASWNKDKNKFITDGHILALHNEHK